VDYLQFDSQQIGHTISWFPPQTRFFSSSDRIAIAGIPLQTPDQNKCTREQYLAYLRTIVQQFYLRVNTYEPVVLIEKHADGFAFTTKAAAGECRYVCRRLVLATGGTAHPRTLGVEGENLPHVSTRLDDPHAYFGKRLMVIGGKNSAVENALRCHHAGAKVSLSYRRPQLDPKHVKYWLYPEISGLLKSEEMHGYFSTVPLKITPSAALLQRADGSTTEVPADFVLMAIGYQADMSLCRMAGIELSGPCQKPVYDRHTMESSVPGIYLAGTVTGGTQDKFVVFIENGHVHIDRILAAITGSAVSSQRPVYEQPES
jgi:thioredoxin reductase (NADPH)